MIISLAACGGHPPGKPKRTEPKEEVATAPAPTEKASEQTEAIEPTSQLPTDTPIPQPTNEYAQNYKIVDTGIKEFYSNISVISAPKQGEDFYGQDALYQINTPAYTDNGDGTITDNVAGLMWQENMGEKMTYREAFEKAKKLELGGYIDWRVPTIKELYSLILFTGSNENGPNGRHVPYIDTNFFNQPFGNPELGERIIDAQTWSSTQYVGTTMRDDPTIFGVNFLDGRIKGYPKYNPRTGEENKLYIRFVRGNPDYGQNNFVANGDGTITDLATGLMWQQADDGTARDWKSALEYAENLDLAGHSDWRLPNAKELQSIVDYTRAPDVTYSPAIDPLFKTTGIADPEGNLGQFPYFWTSTTHLDGANPYSAAVYIAFGKAQGKMHNQLMDVHGAGAQRSDPKTGEKENYPQYFGPQGDVRYVFNYVRCVRATK